MIESRCFDEYDVLGFLIHIRSIVSEELKGNIKCILDFADLIAHRQRDRGIAIKAISSAIDFNYETEKDMRTVKGYHGVSYEDWENNWKYLARMYRFNINDEIIKELAICVISLAQFSQYSSGKYKGEMQVLCTKKGISLITTEGTSDSLCIGYFVVETPLKIRCEDAGTISEVLETKRTNGFLSLFAGEKKIIEEV